MTGKGTAVLSWKRLNNKKKFFIEGGETLEQVIRRSC